MSDDLDSLVKGAPLPSRAPAAAAAAAVADSTLTAGGGVKVGDPLSITPSSPSMIYLNLLILEASLRAQYLALRARRRHHTFFLLLLGAWNLGFGYALFLAPREDGSGVGGSVYWVVDVLEKVCFMGGVITAALVWATGIWDRGVRWPRRWFSVSNRGLRHINCKLVLLKRPWYAEAVATLAWFLTYGLLSNSGGASSYRFVEPAVLREVERELNLNATGGPVHPSVVASASAGLDEEKAPRGSLRTASGAGLGYYANPAGAGDGREEDLAPGGDYVKLLLLAKPFSPTFRENWEIYRQEYWDRENERRALVRQKLKAQDRALRRSTGGWLWWLPGRGVPSSRLRAEAQAQAQAQRHASHHSLHHRSARGSDAGEKHGHHHPQHPRHAAVEREHRRTRSNSGSTRRGSTSLASLSSAGPPSDGGDASASTGTGSGGTPPPDSLDDVAAAMARKASTGSSASERRRKKTSVSSPSRRPTTGDSRSVTPDTPSPLARESSISSAASGSVPERGSRTMP